MKQMFQRLLITTLFVLCYCLFPAVLPAMAEESCPECHSTEPTMDQVNRSCLSEPLAEVPETPEGSDASFEAVSVAKDLNDAYFIDSFDVNNDDRPDIVTYGLGLGKVVWYENPGLENGRDGDYDYQNWEEHYIANFSVPVPMVHADIDGDGFEDFAIAYKYGQSILHGKRDDGAISWVKNPGYFDGTEDWTTYPIGKLFAAHRMAIGHFTQTEKLELMVLPIIGGENGQLHKPVPTTLYTVPDNPLKGEEWEATVINDSLRMIHAVTPDQYAKVAKVPSASDPELDSALVASEEGVNWLYYGDDGNWHDVVLGKGDMTQLGDRAPEMTETKWKGTGNLAMGTLGDDPMAYIATIEPFHGNTVALYTKDSEESLATDWDRKILDVYGAPRGPICEGPGHHLVTADFDGDKDEEFLVALRGPMPWRGVYYYKAVDGDKTQYEKTRVSSASAARIALNDFDGDGRLDFATTGYYVPNYFYARDPQTLVFLNRIDQVDDK